jgi:hypothetical protein
MKFTCKVANQEITPYHNQYFSKVAEQYLKGSNLHPLFADISASRLGTKILKFQDRISRNPSIRHLLLQQQKRKWGV